QLYSNASLPRLLAVDSHGDIVVTGYPPPEAGSLWAAVKYSGTSGAVLWGPVLLGGPNPFPPTVCPGECFDPNNAEAAFDRQDNFLLAGTSYDEHGHLGWLPAKYDRATGQALWAPAEKKSDGGYDVPRGIVVDSGGDVLVAGTASLDSVVVKYSGSTGAKLFGPVPVGGSVLG